MSSNTPIYGHSRGYRVLAVFAMVATVVSLLDLARAMGPRIVGVAGAIGFAAIFVYSWRRAVRRVVVLHIQESGFSVDDPAQPFGLIEFDEIEELRIYALMERPVVAFRLHHPDHLRRRGPVLIRAMAKVSWPWRQYHIVVQLDAWNDQVASIKSVAVKAGVPIRSELL